MFLIARLIGKEDRSLKEFKSASPVGVRVEWSRPREKRYEKGVSFRTLCAVVDGPHASSQVACIF